MSLDIYLEGPMYETECRCSACGLNHKRMTCEERFHDNITGNLYPMLKEAGIGDLLWDKMTGRVAGEQVDVLTAALKKMRAAPEHFRKFDAKNGYGKYEDAVRFLERVIAACKEFPTATLHTT